MAPNTEIEPRNSETQEVRSYDFQLAGKLNSAQAELLASVHEDLIRNLSSAFSNALRVSFDVKLAALDEYPFTQLVSQTPANTFVSSVLFQPQNTLGGIQMDLNLAFPILDLMMGGPGMGQIPNRSLTDIEDHLMQEVTRMVCAELERSWKSLDIAASAGERQKPAQFQKLLMPGERVLLLRLTAKLFDTQGSLNIFFPAAIAVAMLRKLSKLTPFPVRASTPSATQKILDRVQECLCTVELTVPGARVSMADLLYLEKGSLLDLGIPLSTPALVSLEGQPWFEAQPVRAGSFRGARFGSQLKKRNLLHG